ncbi:MAG: hypothetical protein JNL98_30540 [Bryobacterales bacterium]|nr:hypothetical protein [Bryobacterales bacterium]
MPMAEPYPTKFALFDKALSLVDSKLNGMYCEFGVFQGTTINYIAERVTGRAVCMDSIPLTGFPRRGGLVFRQARSRLRTFLACGRT